MPEQCRWHQTDACMGRGQLVLQQVEHELGLVTALGRLGSFCSTHSLLSWLKAETAAMEVPRRWGSPGPGGGRRRVSHPENRPVVTRELPRGGRRQR